jgi:hypothetical protein
MFSVDLNDENKNWYKKQIEKNNTKLAEIEYGIELAQKILRENIKRDLAILKNLRQAKKSLVAETIQYAIKASGVCEESLLTIKE